MAAIQATAQFLQHKMTIYPGQQPSYDYAYNIKGVPWIDMTCKQDTPPAHLLQLMSREHAKAQPYAVTDGTTTITLIPHIRSARVYFDLSLGQHVAAIDLIWLKADGMTPTHAAPYVSTLDADIESAHIAHEQTLRAAIPITLS